MSNVYYSKRFSLRVTCMSSSVLILCFVQSMKTIIIRMKYILLKFEVVLCEMTRNTDFSL